MQLADKVHAMTGPTAPRGAVDNAPQAVPREVWDLSAEGQRMCDAGQTRGGIMRLREAIRIMVHRTTTLLP